jgi:VanZ family protein
MNPPSSPSPAAIRNPQTALYYWLPPILWMAMMFGFSTEAFSADNTGSRLLWLLQHLYPAITVSQYETIHFLIRKMAHFIGYAFLTLLWWRAWRAASPQKWQGEWAWRSFAIIAVWALLDEWHQTFTANRTGSIYDSLLDMSGGAAALAVLWLWQNRDSA